MKQKGTEQRWKRSFDLALTAAALPILCPLLLLIAATARLTMGKPVLFRQLRAGRGGAAITLWKFRTMSQARDASGKLLPDDMRLTRFGRFLRTTSLDELPQLWNLLRGDVSLVGPRPLLLEYLPHYTSEQARRHEVLPGITNLPAIHGRNALSWEEKFALDTWYVDHWSLWLDARILCLSVWRVLRRDGISHPGHATMPKFTGKESAPSACPEKTLS